MEYRRDGGLLVEEATILATPQEEGQRSRASSTLDDRLARCKGLGIVLISITTASFATSMFVVKLLSHVSPMGVMLGSSLIQLSVYLPNAILSGCNFSGEPGERHLLFLRAFFGLIAVSTQYYSITLMPLVDASTIIFSYPAFVSIFGRIFLKEKYGLFHVGMIAFILTGVVLVTKPSFIFGSEEEYSYYHLLGACFAFISCLSQASVAIVLRKLQKTSAPLVTFYFAVFNIIGSAGALMLLGDYRWPNCGSDGVLICFSGMVYALGQIFYTIASKIEKAGILAIVRSMDIVLTFILQMVFLGVYPPWNSYLGGGIIFLCVLLIAFQKCKKDINDSPRYEISSKKM